MISEVLVILVVIAVVYFMFIKKPSITNKKSTPKAEQKSEDMVACHSCGTYSSVSDCIIKGGYYYCSNECLEG
jgi:uncharacterized protein (UPF0333 family)